MAAQQKSLRLSRAAFVLLTKCLKYDYISPRLPFTTPWKYDVNACFYGQFPTHTSSHPHHPATMKTQLSTSVPSFQIGEFEAPLRYLEEALPALGERIGLQGEDLQKFVATGMASACACRPLLAPDALSQGMIEPVPEARIFWNLIGDLLLDESSSIIGAEHLRTAMHLQREGFNVVLVQNHRSGSDILVMETLIRRFFGRDVCASWSYMAGHVINLFLIPLMFSAGIRRCQIFAVKYQSTDIPGTTVDDMKCQNQRAMTCLMRHVEPGGTLTVYYPEGGRGTGGMMRGEPRATCIPRNIALNKKKPLIILPTFVDGTERLLPQARGENEFNEVLERMQRGRADLIIGKPVPWEALCAANVQHKGDKHEWNRRMSDTMLALVARLGPPAEAGFYSEDNEYVRELLSHFPQGGVP